MRILLLYDTMDRPETELIKRIARPGLQLDVICNKSHGFWELLKDSPISVEHFPCRSRLDFAMVRHLRAKLKAERYDLIHAFTSRTLSAVNIALCGLRNRPRLIAYRGALGNVSRLDPTTWLTFRNPGIEKINCVSDAVKNYLKESGIAERKLVRIYKGHDVNWYRAEPAKREEFGIPANSFVVGCVANMRPNKGVDLLIEAALAVPPEKNVYFLIAGDMRGLELGSFSGSAELRSRIKIIGRRDDIPALLQCCDVFVMPSRYTEGLPKAVIEAMALEVPVIVSRIGGMIELVRDRVDGLVIEPRSVPHLCRAILELQEFPELRKQLGRAGKQRIIDGFSIEQTVRETLDLYCADSSS